VVAVDALLNYMLGKARASGVEFEVTISGSVKYMAENVVSAQDLTTLLADLIDNAITATKHRDKKKILVLIGIVDGCYRIDVFDSGIAFEPDTLSDLGVKKTTTHAESGGSGIGMMTTFEILKRYHASFAIEEYGDSDCLFTKKVSVSFDRMHRFGVIMGSADNIETDAREESMLVCK
jgi:sensor histidine kinase regulating citrate/malate metabolism